MLLIKQTHDWRHGEAVQNDRKQYDQSEEAPQTFGRIDVDVVQTIGQVIDRSDAADAKESQRQFFRAVSPVAGSSRSVQ